MIVPMAKVRIFGPRALLDDATCLLYRSGVVHVEPLSPGLVSRAQVRDRRTEDRDAVRERVALEALADKVRKSLLLLPRPGTLEAGPPPPSAGELLRGETVRTVEELFPRIEALAARRKETADRFALLSRYQKMAGAILPLVERAGSTAHLEMVGLTIARESEGVMALLEEELRRATGGLVQVFATEVDERTLAALVLYGRSHASQVRALLWDRNLSELKLPAEIERLPLREALDEIAHQSEGLPAELRSIDAESELLAVQWRAWLASLNDALAARLRQLGTRSSFFKTRYSFVISGWIPQRHLPELTREVQDLSGGRMVLEEVAVSPEEEQDVPVHLSNPAFIRPFEVFVRLLPPPVYRTVDPTPFLAAFFPLFFGLIVGDAGYGLVIGALALALRRRYPPGNPLRDLLTVLAASSAIAVLFGLLFGEFFGTLGEGLGMRPVHPRLHRLTAIPFFLGLSIGIGCLHVFLGLALGLVNAVRRRHRAGLWHRGGQAAALAGLILTIAAAAGAVDRALLAPSVLLLLGGLTAWIVGEGFAAPIELISTAGNVLSYARLMAVGLAGVVLAMVANELGSRSPWGVPVAVALHIINLVLCVFSPTIHAMRLHLVEFFTKFYETGGAEYRPLKRQEGA